MTAASQLAVLPPGHHTPKQHEEPARAEVLLLTAVGGPSEPTTEPEAPRAAQEQWVFIFLGAETSLRTW